MIERVGMPALAAAMRPVGEQGAGQPAGGAAALRPEPPPAEPRGVSQSDRLILARLQLRQSQVLQAENAATFKSPGKVMPSYSYQIGPDGRAYVVGGSVPLYASPVFGGVGEFRGVVSASGAPADGGTSGQESTGASVLLDIEA